MMVFGNQPLSRLGRLSMVALLLAAFALLGACATMPETESAEQEDDVSVVEPPAAEVAEVKTEEPGAATVEEAKADEPVVEVVAEAETTEEEVAAPVVEDWTQHFVAEGNYVFMGNPEAPVTILDVSDFL